MVFAVAIVSLPAPVAVARFPITSSFLPSVCPIEAILATICSTEEEDCDTLAACISILLFSCLMVRIISSSVAAVSVTLAACVKACCFTPSIFALISFTALAVSVILEASSFPMSSIFLLFIPTVCIELAIFAIVSLKYWESSAISSLPRTGNRTVRSPSPCAMFLSALLVNCKGLLTRRLTNIYSKITTATKITVY